MWSAASLLLVLSLTGSNGKECFELPKGYDMGSLLPRSVTGPHNRTLNVASLFDKNPDPIKGTRANMTAMKIGFGIPHTFPEAKDVTLTGVGHFTVTIDEEEQEGVLTQMLILDQANKNTHQIELYPQHEASKIWIQGPDVGEAWLSELRFEASDKARSPTFAWDNNGDDDGDDDWDDDYGYGDDFHEYDATTVTGPCECNGWDGDGHGKECKAWDNDCGASGWCYVNAGACTDTRVSHSYPGKYWSCAPCLNASQSPPPKPKLKPKSKGFCECMPGNEYGFGCKAWDDDCGSSGWCYVPNGTCTDGAQSGVSDKFWSCLACKFDKHSNLTKHTRPPTLPKPPKNKPVPVPEKCQSCIGIMILGITLGVMMGFTAMFVIGRTSTGPPKKQSKGGYRRADNEMLNMD